MQMRTRHLGWSSALHCVGLVLFLVIVYGPVGALVVESCRAVARSNFDWLLLALPSGRRAGLLIRSVGLASGVALSSTTIGLLVACTLWQWRAGARAYVRWGLLLFAPLPPYIHAMAWTSTWTAFTTLFHLQSLSSMTGWLGAWWILTMAWLPVATGFALVGLESVDVALIEAGRVARADPPVFLKVVVPLALPYMIVGGVLGLVLTLTDYSVPSLCSVNVTALDVFAEYSASNEPARAFLRALPILTITALAAILCQAPLRRAAQSPPRRRREPSPSLAMPRRLTQPRRAALALMFMQIAVPLLSLLVATGSWKSLTLSISAARADIASSAWQAIVTVALCVPIGLAVAQELDGYGHRARLWLFLATAPLAIPAPLAGIGVITIWNRPAWIDLYGSSLAPAMATSARFAPFAALIMAAQWRRLDHLLIDAARVHQTSALRTWLQVRLPMLAPGLAAAACVVFALSIGELGATLLVTPAGASTLTMRIYNYLHYGASGTVAGLCLVMTAVALGAVGLALGILGGWNIIGSSTDRGGRS